MKTVLISGVGWPKVDQQVKKKPKKVYKKKITKTDLNFEAWVAKQKTFSDFSFLSK